MVRHRMTPQGPAPPGSSRCHPAPRVLTSPHSPFPLPLGSAEGRGVGHRPPEGGEPPPSEVFGSWPLAAAFATVAGSGSGSPLAWLIRKARASSTSLGDRKRAKLT